MKASSHPGLRHGLCIGMALALGIASLLSARAQSADDFKPVLNGRVYALAEQVAGKILIAGNFTSVNGQTRQRIARLHADGTLDEGFTAGANSSVKVLTLQRDGKILVGGTFTTINGQPATNIARLHPDGSWDAGFSAGTGQNPATGTEVKSLLLQSDGKILVAGEFGALNNYWCDRLGRLNTNGTLDTSFGTGGFVDGGSLHALAIQTDGKILAAGDFTTLVGYWKYGIGRMTDMGMDTGFSPGEIYSTQYAVYCLAIQADGKILVGGNFANLAGSASSNLARLGASGAVDGSFGSGANGVVNAVVIQADGQMLVGGQFTALNGQARNRIARLNLDGSVDPGFSPDADGAVDALAILADGKILVGGSFTNIGGQSRPYLARLNNDRVATQNLFTNGSTLTWQRGGSSPEVWRTQFEYSTNGTEWINLGNGLRVTGGWQVMGVSLPGPAVVRAWAPAAGGAGGGSGRFLQTSIGAPLCALQPVSRTNNLGTTVTFTSLAVGAAPLSYQWRKDGVLLVDGAGIGGTFTPNLTLTNCLQSDAGGYSVVFSNSSGSLTSLVATLTVLDPGLANQLTNQYRELGQVAVFSVTAEGTLPFSYQWWKDGAPMTQLSTNTLTLTNLQTSDAGRYHVVVSNINGSVTSAVAVLTVNSITAAASFVTNTSGVVGPIVVQTDGRALVGATMSSFGSLHRRNLDGSVDGQFLPGVGGTTYALAVQLDGGIVVGGSFTSIGGLTRTSIGRVTAGGVLDSGFNPIIRGTSQFVKALALQPDDKILVGGRFTSVNVQARTNLARLLASGELDADFNPAVDSDVNAIAIQADEKILLGGHFATITGQPRVRLARLQSNGTLDQDFTPTVAHEPSGAPYVNCLAVQADGKILVGGYFTSIAGIARANLARLHGDGAVDLDFNPGASGVVDSIALLTDGKILVGGNFASMGGLAHRYLACLLPDGSVDLTFNPGVTGLAPYLNAVFVEADGNILVGGSFTGLGGQARTNLGRLHQAAPVLDQLSHDSNSVTWERGGAAPEVNRVVFDHSADGSNWSLFGPGLRGPGGWQLTNLVVPPGGTIRARGQVIGGDGNASSGWVETMIGAPILVGQPVSRTNNFGTTASFGVVADGPAPLAFQWLKDGSPLSDGTGIGGALTSVLTLTNVSKFTEGEYRVVINNNSGSITSAVAILMVIDPLLTGQSIGGYREVGQSATFTVTAAGTGLTYQWSKNGSPLSQATNPALALTNIQLGDAGTYRAVVTGTYGSVTSILGTLTVNAAGLDTNFNANVNGWVAPVLVQTDGKIIFGGGFTTVGGQARGRLARVNPNGVLDTTFSNPNANDDVYALALQPDGKLLVGGEFTTLGGQARYALGRLNTNGTLDTTFNATVFNPEPIPPYTSYRVQAILLQPDGKVVVGTRASRTLQNGMTFITGGVIRLNTNGVLDNTFSTGTIGAPIASLAWQPDGKILVGGLFSSVGGQTRNRIARLHPHGAVDLDFNPGLAAPSGINPVPLAMMVQPDGKIVVGGAFTTIAGQSQTNLARLHENGSLDDTFRPVLGGATYPDVHSVVLQTDGRIILGGMFNSLNGVTRSRVGRLNTDGTLDISFNPGANSDVYGVTLQPDGKVLVTGFFFQLAGQPRSYIARLNNTEPATQSLTYSNNTVAWSRGGTGPEVWRTTLESSTNGTNWILLGNGSRGDGLWHFTAPALPPGGFVRVRGFTAGGGYNAASWFAESRLRITPGIHANDGSFGLQSNLFSFNLSAPAGAAVVVEASTNLVQWSPIFTNLIEAAGLFLFQDLNSGLYPRRFYRARFHTGPLPSPSFPSHAAAMLNGHFTVQLGGIAGQTAVIESSTNLLNWTPLITNTFGLTPFIFSDPGTTNLPMQFYRARLP